MSLATFLFYHPKERSVPVVADLPLRNEKSPQIKLVLPCCTSHCIILYTLHFPQKGLVYPISLWVQSSYKSTQWEPLLWLHVPIGPVMRRLGVTNLEGHREYLLGGSCQFQPFPWPYESKTRRSRAACIVIGLTWVDNFEDLF